MSAGELSVTAVGGGGREPITAAAVAAQTGGRLIGSGEVRVAGIAALDRATGSDLSLLTHRRYLGWFSKSKAGVVLLTPEFAELPVGPAIRIVVDKPTEAILGVLAHFRRPDGRGRGVHPRAVIADGVLLGEGVTVEAGAVIAEEVQIGAGSWIGANATIGTGTVVGRDVRVHANASVYPWCEIGDRVIIHSGASVGREGFGFVPTPTGVTRIPHIGRCVLEHDVEIGANSCVDRGSVDDTIVGAGTKIDNLVQVAHNVRIGRMCFIASQVGIAGSARIDDGVQLGGQAGVNGHVHISGRSTIAGQAGVFGDVPAGALWSGHPARPHRDVLRTAAALNRLARIVRPLERLVEGQGDPQDGSA